MNKDSITTFVAFNFWANARILACCDQITNDEFLRPVTPDPGWGSLRGILVHTLDVEYGWRSALQSLPESGILQEDEVPDVAALRARWEVEKAAWMAYLASLDDATLVQGYGADPQNSPLVWQTIMHVVTHGIQHRGEAATFLTGYGHSPGELDFDFFLLEQAGGSA